MTTTATHAYVTAIANGLTPIPFDFQAAGVDEVSVRLNDVPLEYITDYTVELNDDGTGFVTPLVSWGTGDVFIYSTPNFQQPANFTRFGAFYPDQFNGPLDRLARGVIALLEDVKRSIKGPFGVPGVEIINSPDTVLGTDGDGNIVQLDKDAFKGDKGDAGDATQLRVKTPYQFGAVGFDPSNWAQWDTVDDSTALQAFFDDAFDPSNQGYTYDWSGHWQIAKPLTFARPLDYTDDATPFNVTYDARRFVCGKLYVMPTAMQPGAVPMDTVLTISGPHSIWLGDIFIHDGNEGVTPYASRRFLNGVKCFQMTEAHIESVTVFGAKRSAVVVDGSYETWTIRDGTPYATGSTSKNNIGLNIGKIEAVGCGSYQGAAGYGYSTAITSWDQGGWNGAAFDTAEATYYGSGLQRTEVTVASTAELKVGDLGRVRTEIAPATFTSIAADAALGTLTWTAGDPVAAGLLVGQRIELVDGSNLGANDGKWFEILSFGGTSNRTITVRPLNGVTITTEAAKVYTQLRSEWSMHRVDVISSATKFLVFPWVPNGTNSAFYLMQGYALETIGVDTAGVNVDYVGGRSLGGGVRSASLYGPNISALLLDHGGVGVVLGMEYSGGTIGLTIAYRHIEGFDIPILQLGATSSGWNIGDGSGLTDLTGVLLLGSRTFPTTARTAACPVGGHLQLAGFDYDFTDRNRVFVKTYGAVGNGASDDTRAIQAAIDAVGNAGGGEVMLRAGSFKISDTLLLNQQAVTLRGAGNFATRFEMQKLDLPCITVSAAHCHIKDLSTHYNGTPIAGASGIFVNAVAHFRLSNVMIRNAFDGLQLAGVSNAYIDNIRVLDYENTGIYCRDVCLDVYVDQFYLNCGISSRGDLGGIRLYNQCEAVVFSNGEVLQGGYAMTIAAAANTAGNRPAYCKFTNIYFDSATNGVNINMAVELTFNDCWFSNRPNHGISLSNTDGVRFTGGGAMNCGTHGVLVNATAVRTTFTNFSARGNSQASANVSSGIAFAPNTTDFIVQGCTLGGSLGFGSQKYGVFVDVGTSDRYIVADNLVTGNSTAGISDGGSGANKRVANNY